MALTKKEKALLAHAIVSLQNAKTEPDSLLYWVGVAEWEIMQVLTPPPPREK